MSALVLTAEQLQSAHNAFVEGASSVFRQWTALELAVFHGWGGVNTATKVQNIRDEVINMFLKSNGSNNPRHKVYKDVSQPFRIFDKVTFNFSYFIIPRISQLF